MTPTKTRPHKPMLAEWTSELLSLSLSLGEAAFQQLTLQQLEHQDALRLSLIVEMV